MTIAIANAPCSWGIYQLADAAGTPFGSILDEIADAGYEGTELGPYGFYPTDVSALKDALAQRRIALPAGSAKEPYHVRSAHAEILDRSRRTCTLISGVGAAYLVILGGGAEARLATAGNSERALRLRSDEWSAFRDGIHAVARMAKDEFGITPVLHPHAGSYVEFEDEIARAIDDLDDGLVQLCIDTGHCAYAGVDPIKLFCDNAARTPYFHFKNVDGAVLAMVRREQIPLGLAVKAGVFCPLDRGIVDFPALVKALNEAGYSGWGCVEQDCDIAGGREPLQDARESFRYLTSLGLGSATVGVPQ